MSNVNVTFASPDPGAPIPNTFAALVAALQLLVSGSLADGTEQVGTLLVQATIPATAEQGAVWCRLGASNSFEGFYTFFSGRWCPSWPHKPGMCQFLRTDPTNLFNLTTGLGNFDSGTPGLAGDFYGWKLRLATDTSGTKTINRTIVAAQEWDPVGGQYLTLLPDLVTKAHEGDKTGAYITNNNLPLIPAVGREYDPAAASSGTATGTARIVVSQFTKGTDVTTDPTASGIGSETPTKYSGLPPFVSYGVIEYLGPIYTDPTIQLAI